MSSKLNIKAFRKALNNLTDEEREKYFPKEDPLPIGWISIEEHLPMVTVQDVIDNNATVKHIMVKDKDGNEFESSVGDHHIWYYMAKDAGITHWYNKG